MDSIIATGNWTIVGTVAAATSAAVLLIGGYFVQRYGHGADAALRARIFPRSGGNVGLEVQVDVRCVGLRAVRLAKHPRYFPTLTISEVSDEDCRFKQQVEHEITAVNLIGQIAGPGESINWTELVCLRAKPSDVTGWMVEFKFSIRHQIARWRYWTWNETVFVPAVNCGTFPCTSESRASKQSGTETGT